MGEVRSLSDDTPSRVSLGNNIPSRSVGDCFPSETIKDTPINFSSLCSKKSGVPFKDYLHVFSPGIWWSKIGFAMEGFAMGQVLHRSAATTEAVRRAIQDSQESLRALSNRYGINQKTVAKWKKRSSVADLPTGLVPN
jgi:hypothetical protein